MYYETLWALMCRVQNWGCTDLQLIFLSWIRIRTGNTEMDPDPAAMKTTKVNKQTSPFTHLKNKNVVPKKKHHQIEKFRVSV
jgi:hypothetical protein